MTISPRFVAFLVTASLISPSVLHARSSTITPRNFATFQRVRYLSSGAQGESVPPSQIDVQVLYTPEVAAIYGGDQGLRDMVNRAFDCDPALSTCTRVNNVEISVNGLMEGSRVPARFRAVQFGIMENFPSGTAPSSSVLSTLVTDEFIEAGRKSVGADTVLLLIKHPDGNAFTHVMNRFTRAGDTLAQILASSNLKRHPFYQVSAHMSAAIVIAIPENPNHDYVTTVMAHEFGHVLGAEHEKTDPTRVPLEPSAAAFIGSGIQTIDANPSTNAFSPHFSSPNIQIQLANGSYLTLGSATVDNVQTMTKMAPMVAGYSERGPLDFTNHKNCRDVNGDGVVAPGDGLAIINLINSGRDAAISKWKDPRTVFLRHKFADVNGDGYITANDFLRIVNYINSPTNPAYSICPN